MKVKSLVPNGLTSLNLVFGVCSIFATIHRDFAWASIFILLALVADGLDGRAARFLHVSSELGKEMDSLCDLVSFGVAPAILAYCFCLNAYGTVGYLVPLLFSVCGMLRLARFNVNADIVHGYFMGVAIPAGGCFIATSTLLFLGTDFNPLSLGYIYPAVMAVVALLMVSEIHYPDFKGAGEKIYLVSKIYAAIVFCLIIYFGREAFVSAVLFAIFATYDTFGIVNSLVRKFSGEAK